METKEQRKRKGRLLLAMPLLVMPFLALGFHAAGGGGVKGSVEVQVAKGINANLPDAEFKLEEPQDKMGFYAKAGKEADTAEGIGMERQLGLSSGAHPMTMEINQKLAALNREINAPVAVAETKFGAKVGLGRQSASLEEDVDRLEQLMLLMQQEKGKDPEVEQLNSLMEKILDVQNPGRVLQRGTVEGKRGVRSERFSAIRAEIDGGQKVVSGASVRLRLLDSVTLAGVVIPKGQLLYGLCKVTNQRLLLDVKNIRMGSLIVPCNLSVYGLDGMVGIDAPDAVFRESVGMGAGDVIGGLQVYGLDGVEAQVAGAGINAAKSLLSRKAKVVRVKLKSGLPLLLRDNDSLGAQ